MFQNYRWKRSKPSVNTEKPKNKDFLFFNHQHHHHHVYYEKAKGNRFFQESVLHVQLQENQDT
jgi:hypothetical protein